MLFIEIANIQGRWQLVRIVENCEHFNIDLNLLAAVDCIAEHFEWHSLAAVEHESIFRKMNGKKTHIKPQQE